jgi:N-methylhydantoinase B/oxoprolinase/acetone carboxylase alpha subunit
MNEKMDKLLRDAIETLKMAKETAQNNVTNMYWTNIKMQNNRKKFSAAEISKGTKLEEELSGLVDEYDRMLVLLEDSVQTAGGEATQELLQKLLNCMEEGKTCLDRQKIIESDMLALDTSLQRRKERSAKLCMLNRRVKI